MRRSKRRRHLPKFGHINNSDIFFLTDRPTRQTDRPTDRQTDIYVYREVTLPKITIYLDSTALAQDLGQFVGLLVRVVSAFTLLQSMCRYYIFYVFFTPCLNLVVTSLFRPFFLTWKKILTILFSPHEKGPQNQTIIVIMAYRKYTKLFMYGSIYYIKKTD